MLCLETRLPELTSPIKKSISKIHLLCLHTFSLKVFSPICNNYRGKRNFAPKCLKYLPKFKLKGKRFMPHAQTNLV